MDSINKNDLEKIRDDFLHGLEEELCEIKTKFLKEIEQLTDKKMEQLRNSTNQTIVKNNTSSTTQSKHFINGKEVSSNELTPEAVIDGKALSEQIIKNVNEHLKKMNGHLHEK
ncbi:hypothetical protein [Fictibacillus fluitans]|uniref:Uncharacterized protein n=1 Tax=Fictibacillus fluitans TaxID=3058422 RepID=A0ABT8HWF7_9BACL|nr:hypothetical protein [Fictibacillus sp. NE201]MDN4525119.1 hypothetical protein [Fictibacillus sp. NE201]